MSVITFNDLITDPDVPANGKTKVYTKSGSPHWRTPDGTIHSLSIPVFGQNVDLSIFESYTMTTSGSSWSTYAGLQMPVNTSGTYLVLALCHARMNTVSYDAKMRLAKNGTTIGEPMVEELKDSSSAESMPRMLLKKVILADGDYLDLDFATENTSGTITVREGCIVLWRIA